MENRYKHESRVVPEIEDPAVFSRTPQHDTIAVQPYNKKLLMALPELSELCRAFVPELCRIIDIPSVKNNTCRRYNQNSHGAVALV